jgi:hypothetical protein
MVVGLVEAEIHSLDVSENTCYFERVDCYFFLNLGGLVAVDRWVSIEEVKV